MSHPESLVKISHSPGYSTLTLYRPNRRNALSLEMLRQLGAALTECNSQSDCRVILLKASGPAFCAGHDLSEMVGRDPSDYQELFETCSEVMQRIRSVRQPVIAVVNGMATAAGCQLVAACDLAIASQESRFATPGVKIGLFCTTPMVPLSRAVPPKVAMEMLLTGVPISADRAYQVGLINAAVPSEELEETVSKFRDAIVNSSADTLHRGKQAFYRQWGMSEAEAYRDASQVMTKNAVTPDAQEGMTAFLEKRAPQWTHQSCDN